MHRASSQELEQLAELLPLLSERVKVRVTPDWHVVQACIWIVHKETQRELQARASNEPIPDEADAF